MSASFFEPLETRQMMSANATINNGVLRIDGTDATEKILVEAVTRTLQANTGHHLPGSSPAPVQQVQKYHVRVADMLGHVINGPDGMPLDEDFPVTGVVRIDVIAR